MRDLSSLIYVVIIGLIAGVLASVLIPMDMGIIGAIVVGILGAVIGFYLFPALGARVSSNPTVASIITSPAGAVILLIGLRIVTAG